MIIGIENIVFLVIFYLVCLVFWYKSITIPFLLFLSWEMKNIQRLDVLILSKCKVKII